MYAKGQGVVRNYVWAYAWFSIASEAGIASSKKHIKSLNNYMTKEQINENNYNLIFDKCEVMMVPVESKYSIGW